MIAMRMRKTAFRNALKAAALGTKFTVSRPRGSFTLHRDVTKPAVFLTGGIGLRRSQHPSVGHPGTSPTQTVFVYSNREAEDAAFIEEFESMTAQNPNFHSHSNGHRA